MTSMMDLNNACFVNIVMRQGGMVLKYNNLGDCRTIDEYVREKLDRLNKTERSFSCLFEFMFSERDGILYERSRGYKIIKTTYGEARDMSLKMASGIKAVLADKPKNSVVGIYLENSVEWIEIFWGILAAGYCPLLLNLRLDTEVIEKTLSDCRAVAVIAEKGEFALPVFSIEDITRAESVTETYEFGESIFVMSTGTSNNVKVCGYGAEEFSVLVSDSEYIVKVCSQIKQFYNGYLKLLTFLPLYHVFGLIAMYIWFAFFASTFVHLENMEPDTILGTIRRHEVTHIFAVPLFWERIYDQAMKTISSQGEATVERFNKGVRIGEKLDAFPALARKFRKTAFKEVRSRLFGESVQYMITGGSPIRPEAFKFFNDIGYHITNGYGMTEIGITSVELSPNVRLRNTLSIGSPLPSVTYKISDEGELWVKGASLARSIRTGDDVIYRGDDWFMTGDLAECVDGRYRVLGRRDDLILLPNGEMLNPNLIEPKFLFKGIDEACLIDAAGGGEAVQPTLLLSVAAGVGPQTSERYREQALKLLSDSMLDIHIKRVVIVRGSMLGDNDFKLNRRKIAEKYLLGEICEHAEEKLDIETAKTQIEQQVAEIFATVLNRSVEEIGVNSDFFGELDGSSLDYFALISGLKEMFSLPFTEGEGMSFHTVKDVCKYIERESGDAD